MYTFIIFNIKLIIFLSHSILMVSLFSIKTVKKNKMSIDVYIIFEKIIIYFAEDHNFYRF